MAALEHGSDVGSGFSTISIGWDSRSLLKTPIDGFEPPERIKQLHVGLAQGRTRVCETLSVLDCESDTIDGDPNLVRHLKFKWRWRRALFVAQQFTNLIHQLKSHDDIRPTKR